MFMMLDLPVFLYSYDKQFLTDLCLNVDDHTPWKVCQMTLFTYVLYPSLKLAEMQTNQRQPIISGNACSARNGLGWQFISHCELLVDWLFSILCLSPHTCLLGHIQFQECYNSQKIHGQHKNIMVFSEWSYKEMWYNLDVMNMWYLWKHV